MAESVLLIADHAGEELHELRRKFHPHQDYLQLIIPSMWLMFGLTAADFYFYRAGHLKHVLTRMVEVAPFFKSASTSLEFFLALLLFIVVFTVIYVVGQLINGVSALLIDRLIVKKLLKYPFELYQRRFNVPEHEVSDRRLFKDLVLGSSYLIYCLNLIPFVFLETVAVLFAARVPAFRDWLVAKSSITAGFLLVLFYFHLGLPTWRKPRRYPEHCSNAAEHYDAFATGHLAFFCTFYFAILYAILMFGWIWSVFGLLAVNLFIGFAERTARSDDEYSSALLRRFFFYSRLCFTNPTYFAAKLVGYGDIPSAATIRTVHAGLGSGGSKDFFWMTYLTVQQHGGNATQTLYHYIAQYQMVRNLCNATAVMLLTSVAAFWNLWPTEHGVAVVTWTLGLCLLMYALFARYLYLYGAYFNKYAIRAAAYVLQRTPHFHRG